MNEERKFLPSASGKATCPVMNCTRPVRRNGLCNGHSLRLKVHGDVLGNVPFKPLFPSKHGLVDLPEYYIWCAMLSRCNDPNNKKYHRYGARGIKVCERWTEFKSFIIDMGRRPFRQAQIERINNDGNYEPKNCKWATRKDQARNTSVNRHLTWNGKTLTVVEWAELLSINPSTIYNRLFRGDSTQRALRPVYG